MKEKEEEKGKQTFFKFQVVENMVSYSGIVLKPVRIFIAFIFVGYSQETCDSRVGGSTLRLWSPFCRPGGGPGLVKSLVCGQKMNYYLGRKGNPPSLDLQAVSGMAGQPLWGG